MMDLINTIRGYLVSPRLVRIFQDAAREARANFPQELKHFMVTLKGRKIYVSPEAAQLLQKNTDKIKEIITQQNQYKADRGQRTIATAGSVIVGEATLKSLNIQRVSSAQLVSDKYPADMNIMAVFDHEAGHLILGESEYAADAYAALRHLQRYGFATDMLTYAPSSRSAFAIFEAYPSHYTSSAIHKIASMVRDGTVDNIRSMTLAATAQLAASITERYSLDSKALYKIHKAYQPIRRKCASADDWRTVIVDIADIMRQNKNDHDVYRAGRLFFEYPDVKKYMQEKADEKPLYQSILNFMKQHEKESGFILNAADAIDAQRGIIHKIKTTPRISAMPS